MAEKKEPSVPHAKTLVAIAAEVKAGKWGTGADRNQKLSDAGYIVSEIDREIEAMDDPDRKSLTELVKEVKAGKWGKPEERAAKLSAAGHTPQAILAQLDDK